MNFASVLQGLVAILWLAVIGMLVLAVVRASRGSKVRALSTSISMSAAW